MTEGPTPASDTAELARLDHEIGMLTARVEQARHVWADYQALLVDTRRRRDLVAARLATLIPAPGPVPPAPARSDSPVSFPSFLGNLTGERDLEPAGRAETSAKTVQNVLFVLGGLVLGAAAIVFTAVSWNDYGEAGRAAILAIVTVLVLATPLVALWRGLRATAETFAGVGLLLVVLDGYAAWYVNLFGVATLPGTRYLALVCAVTAAVAMAYRLLTRLVGPTFFAVFLIQPVAPLLAGEAHPTATGWALVLAASALLNLAVVGFTGGRGPVPAGRPGAAYLRGIAWTLFAGALFGSAIASATALSTIHNGVTAAWAGLAVIVTAATFAGGTALTRSAALHSLGGCVMVLAVAVAGAFLIATVQPGQSLVLISGLVAAIAIVATVLARVLPAGVRPGPAAGAIVAAGVLGVVLATVTLLVAVSTVEKALPLWHAQLDGRARFDIQARLDWQLLAALGFAAVAWSASLYGSASRATQRDVATGFGVLIVLALPGAATLAWWTPSVVDIMGAGALVVGAALTRTTRSTAVLGVLAGALATHGVLASLGRPGHTAAVLGAVVVLGIAASTLSRRNDSTSARVVGGATVLASMLALPGAVGSAAVAAGLTPWCAARLTVTCLLLVLAGLVGCRRWWPDLRWYGFAGTLVAAGLAPAVAALTSGDPVGVYGAASLVLTAIALLPMRGSTWGSSSPGSHSLDSGSPTNGEERTAALVAISTAWIGAIMLATAAVPAVLSVVVLPYAWLAAVWSGVPQGLGLAPAGGADALPPVTAVAAVALAGLAIAAATTTYALRHRVSAAIGGLGIGGPTAIIVAFAAAGAPWPTVPAVTLLLGLVIVVTAALVPLGPWRNAIVPGQGVLYIAAGLSGSLSVEWSTLTALGSIVVSAAIVGAAGRTVAWRVVGWVTGTVAALTTAAAAGLAADLAVREAAFAVLGVAALMLVLGAALRRRDGRESAAVSAAAHAGGVVAILLTAGSAGHAAAASTLWGVAIGLRALWPGTSRQERAILAAVAAGWELVAWWLLLAARDVVLTEAYTLPLAAVALLAGFAALRSRPELRSWVTFGPALAAAFLPSLATILAPGLGDPDSPLRRLLVGAGALVIVLAGSMRRLQAPVVIGGTVLVIVALHEIVLVWDLLDRWIPLAVGGLILVGLAITYERRLRDLATLRGAVARMR